MIQEIAEIWTEALESGKYKQGKNSLVQGPPSKRLYCCLGVLCDLANKAGVTDGTNDQEDEEGRTILDEGWAFLDDGHQLPEVVRIWAGMNSTYGLFGYRSEENLTDMNDGGDSFSEIASRIREKVEVL